MSKWPIKPLGEICEINPRSNGAEKLGPSQEVSFVPMAAVDEITGLISAPETRTAAECLKGFTAFQDGDVLFAKITPCMENGKAAIARNLVGGRGFGSTEFHVLRPRNGVLAEWVFAFVRQPAFREAAKRSFTGSAGQQRVPTDFLRAVPIPVPPFAEQERIVRLLEEAAALRRLRTQADLQTEGAAGALFSELFKAGTPDTRLADVLCRMTNGVNLPQLSGTEGEWPISRIETIADGVVDPDRVRWVAKDAEVLARYRLRPGDILFSHINSPAHIGKTAIYEGVPETLIHGINLLLLRPDPEKVDPVWLVSMLKQQRAREYFQRVCKRAINQASVNQKDVGEFMFSLPPLNQQRTFAARVAEIRALEAEQTNSRKRLDDLFQSLLQRAFNGDI